jgi:F0F1-type ATP synthase assembly protein I
VTFVLQNGAVAKIGGHPNHRRDGQLPFLRRTGLYLGVAFELPGTILGGLLVGYLLDDYFHSSPWLLITLTAAAFAGAFVRLVHWVRFFARERDGKRVEEDDTTH